MNEPRLTQEQRALIAPHERHLHSAVYADYVVALSTTAATTLFNVYNTVFAANELNKHCAQCVLRVCKRLGTLYYGETTETATTGTKTTSKGQTAKGGKKATTQGGKRGRKK